MNREIRRVGIVAGVMMFALLANVSVRSVVEHDFIRRYPYNTRVMTAEFGAERGAILAGTTTIAKSVPFDDNTYKFAREYPQGPLYSHITGYYSRGRGTAGLEYSFARELAGTADSMQVSRLWDQLLGKPPKGGTIETTIDPKLQKAARQAMGTRPGAMVVLETTTGKVKALVSTPEYDPNLLSSLNKKQEEANWKALEADKSKPDRDRAVREIYPPGSTFKMVVAAAALESGLTDKTLIETPAKLTLPGTSSVLTNQGNCGNDKVTLRVALRDSCNTSFANLGMELGEQKIGEQAKKFGFGSRHLKDLGGSASSFPTGMNKAQLAQSSIGQFDVTASPLQMAMVTAAIANNGQVMEPYIVETVRNANLDVVKKYDPASAGQALSSENAKVLQDMMFEVVEKGSGANAAIYGQKIGGKTGTAEHGVGQWPYGWFAAFSPQANLSIVTFVQDAPDVYDRDRPFAGSAIAAPMTRQVLQAALS